MNLHSILMHRILHSLTAAGLLLGLLGASGSAMAQDALKMYLEKATAGLPGRVEISIGTLDERLKLGPCGRAEPYIPAGVRLWGKTQIGLRCVEGSKWSVFLPVEVRVYGKALVAARAIAFNEQVTPNDVRLEDVEFTKEPGMAISDPRSLEGKNTTRQIAAGALLHPEFFRAPPSIGAGDQVQVVYKGEGFNISTSGRAIGNAAEGQPVRVQTDTGRIVQGVARAGKMVEMRL